MGLKDYKIVWFTEGGWQGKVSLDNPNMRNDVSTKWLLGAEHYPIFQMPQILEHFGEKHFDFGNLLDSRLLMKISLYFI